MKFLGNEIIHYNTINSTQTEIWKRIEDNNIENGTVIMADIQTDGKRNSWKNLAHR